MSSRKAATTKAAVRRSPAAQPAAKPALKVAAAPAAKSVADGEASKDAIALAAVIERGIKDGQLDTLSPKAFQSLMAALCKNYAAQLEAGKDFLPLGDRNAVSPTEIMMTTSSLLKAANLAVFELGMWQSWTGR